MKPNKQNVLSVCDKLWDVKSKTAGGGFSPTEMSNFDTTWKL